MFDFNVQNHIFLAGEVMENSIIESEDKIYFDLRFLRGQTRHLQYPQIFPVQLDRSADPGCIEAGRRLFVFGKLDRRKALEHEAGRWRLTVTAEAIYPETRSRDFAHLAIELLHSRYGLDFGPVDDADEGSEMENEDYPFDC